MRYCLGIDKAAAEAGAAVFNWFVDRFGAPMTAGGDTDFAALEVAAAAMPRGASGVIFIPYITGGADAVARGSFFGVSSHTTQDHLVRAVYEALCFSARDGLAMRPQTLMLTGQRINNRFWPQLFADICGVPVAMTPNITCTPDPVAAADYDGWFQLYRQTRDVYRRHAAQKVSA